VALEWRADGLPWVQVHTADRPEPELHRAALAIEPMTCPPNALQSGEDVVRLTPGGSHSVRWHIHPL
jgi:aldose 1-epimerase